MIMLEASRRLSLRLALQLQTQSDAADVKELLKRER